MAASVVDGGHELGEARSLGEIGGSPVLAEVQVEGGGRSHGLHHPWRGQGLVLPQDGAGELGVDGLSRAGLCDATVAEVGDDPVGDALANLVSPGAVGGDPDQHLGGEADPGSRAVAQADDRPLPLDRLPVQEPAEGGREAFDLLPANGPLPDHGLAREAGADDDVDPPRRQGLERDDGSSGGHEVAKAGRGR
ncbi:MAG TPA: hypothetical protein VFD01_10135 [Candidatus Dormibacteraeota bacterium]|nr:hypothetical protein [Candidatus Dormibacteraeota bacterium]